MSIGEKKRFEVNRGERKREKSRVSCRERRRRRFGFGTLEG